MAVAPTLSSSLPFINVSPRFIFANPYSFGSIFLQRRIHRLNSYRGFQSRRRYESDFFGGYEYDVVPDDEDDDEEDERESSIDLLIRFLQSMFKKVSKLAKKASRRILPAAMSPRLVSFAVDGILLLGSLSITRAFLEVVSYQFAYSNYRFLSNLLQLVDQRVRMTVLVHRTVLDCVCRIE